MFGSEKVDLMVDILFSAGSQVLFPENLIIRCNGRYYNFFSCTAVHVRAIEAVTNGGASA